MWRNVIKTKREVLPLFYGSERIVVFDTETTGLGKDAKIIQFSGIRYDLDENLSMTKPVILDIHINPEEPLSEKIVEITGITNEILSVAKTEAEQFDLIKEFLESADLWVAYNSPFDLRMLSQMEERLERKISRRKCVDVLALARDLVSRQEVENYKLENLVGYLFPEMNVNFHSAIEDVRATQQCLQKLILDLQAYEEDNTEKLRAYLEWVSFSINPRAKSQKRIKLKLNFGEYGDIFWDVPKKCWNSKTDTKAKKLFASLDMQDLERQVLNRYGWRYHANNMDELAYAMEKAKKEKEAS